MWLQAEGNVCVAGEFEKYTIPVWIQYRHREEWLEYDYNISWNVISDIETCLKKSSVNKSAIFFKGTSPAGSWYVHGGTGRGRELID